MIIFGLLRSVAIANPSSAKFFSYSGNTRGGVQGGRGCVVVVTTRRRVVEQQHRPAKWLHQTNRHLNWKYFNGNLNWINWVILIGILLGDQI